MIRKRTTAAAETAARIALITGASLAHNPRTLKEAITLRRAGYGVTVLGVAVDHPRLETDLALARKHGFVFKPVGSVGDPRSLLGDKLWGRRLRSRVARVAFRFTKIENRHLLGDFTSELLRASRFMAADLCIVHLEQAMWVGAQLLGQGYKVGVDMEDWFSEDLLPEDRKHRPVQLLKQLERKLLNAAVYASCTSCAMSESLAVDYGCRRPAVVYNAFEWAEREAIDGQLNDRQDRRIPSLHWYSQTLGPGRGLEDLFAALPRLKGDVVLHLRGTPVTKFHDWLGSYLPPEWRARVKIHGLVPNTALLSRIAEHDIGFAGEMRFCRSRDLTVTNKILHYLLAGLAVVASDTAGQREVAAQAPEAVFTYPSGDPEALAVQIDKLLNSPDRLAKAKAAALRAAERTFCWERCAPRLIESVEQALSLPNGSCGQASNWGGCPATIA